MAHVTWMTAVTRKLFIRDKFVVKRLINTTRQMNNCTFCGIVSGINFSEILYQDEEITVFKDIKPASDFHYLVVPKEHIENVTSLTADHIDLVNRLVEIGKQVLQETGGDVDDVRLGFHLPPFNTISHLHLHVIAPASNMTHMAKLIFKPHSFWFKTPEEIIQKIMKNNKS